ANYLTALTERYKSVKIRTDTEYTDTDAWFFPDGGSVVQLIQHVFKASGTSSDLSGSAGDLDFFVEDDGSVFARGVVRAAPAVTPDPEYDAINTYLIDRLRGGTLDELAETDAGYTFRVSVPSYADNSPYIYRCTADKDTLALTEIREEGPEAALLCTVEYGGELPALADTYTAAMRKVRTVTYHASRDGKTYDTVFRVPADWSFYADTGDNALYADADLTAYSDSLVPSDGKDYAFWMTDGMSAAGSDGLPFTLKQVTDANYITALVKQYGQVAVHASYGYGTSEYAFFPYGDSVASYSEEEFEFDAGPTRSRTGIYGDLCFEVDEAGKTLATSYVIPGASDDEDYIAYETDTEGAFFSDNRRLNSVFWNSAIKDLTQDGDTYTFLSDSSSEEGAEYEYAETYTVTVDKGTLAIRRILLTGDAYAAEVEYGKDIVPFAKTFSDAFADTRKLTYHVQMNGEKSDYAFEVPKTWDFTLGIVGDNLRFFRDKGLTDPTENLVPADQWNHEIWVTDARG
ncbi:MAG: hypothetical protein K6A33_00170, partial [Clostridiales bacterium]|nr:hypothetical protein [Clostridiales bacterium]